MYLCKSSMPKCVAAGIVTTETFKINFFEHFHWLALGNMAEKYTRCRFGFIPTYGKFMAVSIGCGLNPKESYSAKDAAKWGILN
ncbi:unnamed protein product [Triticum turgidum subsp. durum]|uniref:Uncharacterized protein n=1 Tax=Triticum turgidum subsp. durum TaxID=4567 RepID=A0A9R0Q422_TRITD|nr:unnamed protein product [Triticum turgidum subsp. durum]